MSHTFLAFLCAYNLSLGFSWKKGFSWFLRFQKKRQMDLFCNFHETRALRQSKGQVTVITMLLTSARAYSTHQHGSKESLSFKNGDKQWCLHYCITFLPISYCIYWIILFEASVTLCNVKWFIFSLHSRGIFFNCFIPFAEVICLMWCSLKKICVQELVELLWHSTTTLTSSI